MPDVSTTWWLMFHVVIVVCLFVDLITSRGKGKLTFRRDLLWSAIWIGVGLCFGGFIYLQFGAESGLKYLTAYVTEKALSVDNLFVFLVIFSFFAVPFETQHKVLFYGIVGAVLFRGAFIYVGISLLESYHWLLYVFGSILLFSGFKLLKGEGGAPDPGENSVVKLVKRIIPVSDNYYGESFWTRVRGHFMFTPLLVVLLVVETTDIMFALDSVPAVLCITEDFFTAYTSNIMAILGLRALYFVVAHAMTELKYLGKGLALVLIYLGVKTLVTPLGFEVPTLWNMAIVLGTLGVFVALSLINKDKGERKMVH